MTEHQKQKHPGIAFRAIVVLVVTLAIYPLSLGPWVIIYTATRSPYETTTVVPYGAYEPIDFAMKASPPAGEEAYDRFVHWCLHVGMSLRR